MSADNTILILSTKGGEFRVGHFQATDNLVWSWNNTSNSDIVCARIFEYFHDIEPVEGETYTIRSNNALESAKKLFEKISYVEYGIQAITIDKTFSEIVIEASKDIKNEIEFVLSDVNMSSEKRIMISEELKTTLNEIHDWLATYG